MSKVDLHIHSTASDGRLSPAEIVHKAVELGLRVIAIADHDSVNGITSALEAARAYPGFRVIPCVEISTDVTTGEAHILGYFIDYTDHKLNTKLEMLRDSRQQRGQKMLAKLKDLGFSIDWQRVQEIAGSGSIGRPHIAQAMLEKGYITSLREAFDKYLGRGAPAYVEREKMSPAEAVELVVRSKGLPVLAHPLTADDLETMVVELKAAGLVGLEAYYNGYNADKVTQLLGLARKYSLIATGGSDYHGLETGVEAIIGGADVPMESAERLVALAEQRGLKLASP